MKRTIEVIVSPKGEVLIDAIGFQGSDCETATRYLEQALGAIGQKEKKPEYHRKVRSQNQQRIGL